MPFVLDGLDEIVNIPKIVVHSAPEKCNPGMELILLNRIRNLVLENQIQNIKVFQENIKNCNYVKNDNRIDAILSFNDEECFIGIDSQTENNVAKYNIMTENDEHHFSLTRENLTNCAYRMGTDALIQEHAN